MRTIVKLVIALVTVLAILVVGACTSLKAAPVINSYSTTPVPSYFKVSSLAVNPAQVNAGVPTLISAKVTNTGAVDDKYSGSVRIDNLDTASLPTFLFPQTVVIPRGASQPLSITTTIKIPGTYQVTWGDINRQLVVNPQDTNSSPLASSGLIEITAPDFTGVDAVNGKTVSLKQFSGRLILLNFVNYGCSPSLNSTVDAQLQAIKKLKQQGLDFMPISVFCGCCPPEVLRQFAQQNNFDWPWLLDTNYSITPKYATYLEKYSYPTLVFIDKNMVIREFTGALNISALNQKLTDLAVNK